MILYLDTSALIKQYTSEAGSPEVQTLIKQADTLGTTLITRAEMAAALAKAVRVNALSQAEALERLESFRKEWVDLIRIEITESVVARADALAWQYGLRGYDAVHPL